MDKKLLIVLLISLLIFGANIWGTSIYILDEARNAGCAMEMYKRHDWVVPTFNNQLRTDKPPLHYYFMRTAYNVFGINPFGARFFSVVMGVLTILSVYFFTKKILNQQTAFLTSLMLVSSIQLAIQFHLAVPDPYLIFLLTTGLLSFHYAFIYEKPRMFYLFYVCISLATLTKGPVAVVFAGAIVGIFLFIRSAFTLKIFSYIKIVQGFFIFCLLVLPWYVAVGIATDGVWLDQFLFKHNIGRFSSSMEGHGGFPLASFVIIIVALMPFSFFLPQMFKTFWDERNENPFLMYCLIAVMVVGIFFAFSRTILPTYPEPALPFFAIILGHCFHKVSKENQKRFLVPGLIYAIIAVALPFVIWFVLLADKSISHLSGLAIYFVVFPIGALVALFFLWRSKLMNAFYSYAATHLAFLVIFFFFIFPKVDQQNPVYKSIDLVKNSTSPVYYYHDVNPAYIMALGKIIPPLDVNDRSSMLVISQKKYLKALESLGFKKVFECQDLFEKPVTIVVAR
jgi:hypothetical protein